MGKLLPSVCIDAVFEGKPYDETCKQVNEVGIHAIEFWDWWNRDLNSLVKAQKENNLEISACCTKFVSLVEPAKREEYLKGLEESIEIAGQIGAKILISQVGDFCRSVPREKQKQSLIDGLKEAASMLEMSEITLVIEPLNDLVDHPGYFLIRSDEAFQIVEAVKSNSVKVIFDIYHQQISEGQLIKNITQNIDKIAHFHAAGNPGRHELQRGEINYPEVFRAIQNTDFEGYVGLEYWPADNNPLELLREVAGWLK